MENVDFKSIRLVQNETITLMPLIAGPDTNLDD